MAALPVPTLTICVLLGVPYEAHAAFQPNGAIGLDRNSPVEDAQRAMGEISSYVKEFVQREMDRPTRADTICAEIAERAPARGSLGCICCQRERGTVPGSLGNLHKCDKPHEAGSHHVVGRYQLVAGCLDQPVVDRRSRASEDRRRDVVGDRETRISHLGGEHRRKGGADRRQPGTREADSVRRVRLRRRRTHDRWSSHGCRRSRRTSNRLLIANICRRPCDRRAALTPGRRISLTRHDTAKVTNASKVARAASPAKIDSAI